MVSLLPKSISLLPKLFSGLLLTSFLLTASACNQLQDIVRELPVDNVAGLRSLLKVSTDTSVVQVSKLNGYFGDALIKIAWPNDAEIIRKTLVDFGFQNEVNDMVLRMNRAAETAAVKASPIFVNAITNITFADAQGIILGQDTAATNYLRLSTQNQLFTAFQPEINGVLAQPLVGTLSAQQAWGSIINIYEGIRTSPANLLLNLPRVDSDLSSFVTRGALNGLFVKLRDHEAAIRNDPRLRVTKEIRDIFRNR